MEFEVHKRVRALCCCFAEAGMDSFLRANAGIYRESQVSSEKSNFGLYHPNNLLVWLFQKMILKKTPSALHLDNFRKVRKFTKKYNFYS